MNIAKHYWTVHFMFIYKYSVHTLFVFSWQNLLLCWEIFLYHNNMKRQTCHFDFTGDKNIPGNLQRAPAQNRTTSTLKMKLQTVFIYETGQHLSTTLGGDV